MGKKPNNKKTLTPDQKKKAFEVASIYFSHKRKEDGSLDSQRKVAAKHGYEPPRFSEALKHAWSGGIVEVIINPPAEDVDLHKLKDMEARLFYKLEKFSPPLIDKDGKKKLREHKLLNVHIVPRNLGLDIKFDGHNSSNMFTPDSTALLNSIMARVCKKAATAFIELIPQLYKKSKKENKKHLYCGIGWSRTCERVVNLVPMPTASYPDLIVCPLIGIIGTKHAPVDAYFLAFRLASNLGGDAIKLPAPCIRPLDLNVGDLEKLRPIKRALEDIKKCEVAISGVGAAHHKLPFVSRLVERKMITPEQLDRIKNSGAVAEIHCNYFDINGRLIPYNELGFAPVGITPVQMERVPRFMMVVSPNREKILAAVATIKAGICSDLFIDHSLAFHILDDKNNDELKLRPEDLHSLEPYWKEKFKLSIVT